MREIKFRAWDSEDGGMFFPETEYNSDSYFTGLDNGLLMCRDLENDEPDGRYKLMQYTGLKDKNGKEIYEGDIIRFTEVDEDSVFGREDTEVVEVKWIEEIAQWRAVFKSGRRTELHFVVQIPTVKSCEIIGNIYENQTLLAN